MTQGRATAARRGIQALERILDCRLLARAARSIGPTETCLSLLPRARHLIREAEHLRDALGGGPVGELRVGAISTALIGLLLPAAIREMALRAPRLRLRLVPGSSLQLFEQLVAGELDAAILVEPPFALPKSLVGHHIRRESHSLYYAVGRLARRNLCSCGERALHPLRSIDLGRPPRRAIHGKKKACRRMFFATSMPWKRSLFWSLKGSATRLCRRGTAESRMA